MINASKVLKEIFILLNQTEYAVLRNFEFLPEKISRDIDIIINRKDFESISRKIVTYFYENDFYLIQYYKGSEMHSMAFASKGEKTEILSFDFLFTVYAKNIVMFEADEVLKSRIFNGKIYHVRRDWEFLAKYVYNAILDQDYPTKYKNVQAEAIATYADEIKDRLAEIGIVNSSLPNSAKIKSHIWRVNFLRTINSTVRYWKATLLNMFSPCGITIGFTGPDGSGKTTVIKAIENELKTVFTGLQTYHFRPMLFGNLGEVAHQAGFKKDVDREYDKPHRGGKVSSLSSIFRLSYYSIDYIAGYYVKVFKTKFKRNITIFDRYYTDIICDSRRSRIYLNTKFLYGFGKLFIPSLDYNILLTARTETIFARKRELDAAGIAAINARIDYLKDKKGYYKVLNEGSSQEAVAKILGFVFEEQHKKNLERLK